MICWIIIFCPKKKLSQSPSSLWRLLRFFPNKSDAEGVLRTGLFMHILSQVSLFLLLILAMSFLILHMALMTSGSRMFSPLVNIKLLNLSPRGKFSKIPQFFIVWKLQLFPGWKTFFLNMEKPLPENLFTSSLLVWPWRLSAALVCWDSEQKMRE